MAVIKVNNVHKTFENGTVTVKAVDGISFEVEKGEFVAIVGPSGSGKTTLLNMIGGLDNTTEGNVLINGMDLTSLSENDLIDFRLKNIGFVFQSYNLIPVLSAMENIEFTMLLQKRSEKERQERAKQLIDSVGLTGKENARPSELSGGQQQRVAVARALAPKPSFVLADEPTANLDSHSTCQLLDIMEKLNQEEEITFVFSTHDQRVIERAKRIITVEDGKIAKDEVVA